MAPAEPRPYFLPDGFDFDAMPAGFTAAYKAIIEPIYDQLVLKAPNSMERAVGATFVFLCYMELLDQFDLGAMMPLADDADARHRKMAQCLRVISSKERWARMLERIRKVQKQNPLRDADPLVA